MAADLREERFQCPQVQFEEIDHIVEVLERWTSGHTVAELVEQGQTMHFPWAAVNSVESLWDNTQLMERGFFVEVPHPELETSFCYPGAPYKFSQSPWRISRRAPLIGEHNRQVFGDELGFSEAEIAALFSEGII
jgi:crotonobetainyl-CoA:carnitine CoA-transferase CaiB-like acyl-CoA transferase